MPSLDPGLAALAADPSILGGRVAHRLDEALLSGVPGLIVSGTGGEVSAAPIDYVELYVSLEEYVPLSEAEDGTAVSVVREIVGSYDRGALLLGLAALDHLCNKRDALEGLAAHYRLALRHDLPRRLDRALSKPGGPSRRIVARQPVLAAMREVLREPLEDGIERDRPSLATAIMLTHAVGSTLSAVREDEGRMLGVFPAHQLLNLARNQALYEEDDVYSSVDRTLHLWREYGPRVWRAEGLRAEPAELLKEATGLELEDMLALGFAAWAYSTQWEPDRPLLLNAKDMGGIAMAEEKIQAFLGLVSATPEELRSGLVRANSPYDFLAIQKKPVARLGGGLLVLDERYLWERFTSGLFWVVNDYLKFELGAEGQRDRWAKAHGKMVEMMVEDRIRSMAPVVPGVEDRTRAFYTEEDFERAYGEGVRRVDAAVDYGHHFVLFEVVGGQLSTGTRVRGEITWFKKDTKRLVVEKCEQLDGSTRAVLGDAQKLTGAPAYPGMRVLPVLVVGGGYPSDPVTRSYVGDLIAEKDLLSDPRVEELAIIDLGELEMLEGLAEHGYGVVALLRDWKRSTLRNVSLRNYLTSEVRDHAEFSRSRKMRARVDAAFEDLQVRLITRDPVLLRDLTPEQLEGTERSLKIRPTDDPGEDARTTEP